MEVFGKEIPDPPSWLSWLFGITFGWITLLVFSATDGRPVHVPNLVNTLFGVYESGQEIYEAGATIALVAGLLVWVAVSLVRRKWKDALSGLGCLMIIAVTAVTLFLIGGWTLLSQLRFGVESGP
jgi:fructose-specific phosphotransferase system IIC component